ncbi:NADP-dependent oxidoreductase [Luteibacter jiangsuensis]|uniref:NADP-dependent oxidoreductase n=1 Tax=Luteibacter jiangsuensis TaxID=637577 RepID=A0ABX0Q615_9GAMM|nr:NADP-dependent oxidoreductase [Luteibacter jiangsuensis]NID05771.1 NADP-dependent oxidoreductase [Luteibacter jiangsuensis]
MSETMKAVRLHAFGGPEVLIYEDAPKPDVRPGEVLVRVMAVGLNPPDWYLRDGYRALPPEWRPDADFPLVLGTDISGVVEATAADVDGFEVGDEVYGMVRFPEGVMTGGGAYAEYVSASAAHLARKPDRLDHVHAAAAPMSLLTAWQFLVELGHDAPNPFQHFPHAPVELEGRTVLINGAGGGVGHLATQLAKARGARVIAVASAKNATMLTEFGVDQFIDYGKTAVETAVRDVDLVLDAVGGPRMERFLSAIKPGGALFLVNPLGFEGHDDAARRGITVSSTQVRSNGAQLAQVAPLLDRQSVRVVIDSVFPLSEAARAHRRVAEGGIQGKIVLSVA